MHRNAWHSYLSTTVGICILILDMRLSAAVTLSKSCTYLHEMTVPPPPQDLGED